MLLRWFIYLTVLPSSSSIINVSVIILPVFSFMIISNGQLFLTLLSFNFPLIEFSVQIVKLVRQLLGILEKRSFPLCPL